MNRYHAIAAQIDSSCYNCRMFELDDTMLSGHCQVMNKKTSALGTCDKFAVKKVAVTSSRK